MRNLVRLVALSSLVAFTGVAHAKDYGARLAGRNEVPARDSNAHGNATFTLSDDGLTLSYKLIVANIDNVVAAHIHLGPAGVNGPIVLFLYGNQPPGGGAIQGVISQGDATGANLIGPLTGQPLSALIAALESGGAYVNVHTNDGVAPTNTGPGDFPGGEIRGQVTISD